MSKKVKLSKINYGSGEIPMQNPEEDNVIISDNHTLVSKDFNPEMVSVSDGGQIIPNIFEKVDGYTLHKFYIGNFTDVSGHGLHKIFNRLQESGLNDMLELHISSYGGSFTEVVSLHNIIDSMYGSRSISYMNHGYSGGAMAFVMCPERIIYKHSTCMFHFFSGGEQGKGSDMLNALNHSIKTIDHYYREQLGDYFTKEELDLMVHHGKEYWFDSVEMMNRGIATGIIINGEYFNSETYKKKFNKNGKIRKKWITEQKKIEAEEAEKSLENAE